MNEKSKAFELIEFVWDNEKTDSYLRVNIAMYEAVKLAIISQMKFNKEDFQNIFSKFSGGYWFGVNANGKGYGENFYREAVTSGNISACQSYEAFCNIKPFIDSKGRRLYKGAMYRDYEKRYRVTGFDFSTKKVYLVGYAISEAKAYAAIAIAEEGMRQKAIEAFKFAVDGYFIIGGTDYSASRLNEFIKKLDS